MKNKYTIHVFLSLLFVILLNGCTSDSELNPVQITGLNPDRGVAGTEVTISGMGFGTETADNVVKFNNMEAVIVFASETSIVAKVPLDAGDGPVTVLVGDNSATGPVFDYLTEPEVSAVYYIKFKADGVWKLFESDNVGFQSCGDCACCTVPLLDESRRSRVEICQEDDNWITAEDILSWEQKTIDFQADDGPGASFWYKENGQGYGTYVVSNQADSWVKISNVEEDGQMGFSEAYKVSGTFHCQVAADSDRPQISITEGSFVIRYTEDW